MEQYLQEMFPEQHYLVIQEALRVCNGNPGVAVNILLQTMGNSPAGASQNTYTQRTHPGPQIPTNTNTETTKVTPGPTTSTNIPRPSVPVIDLISPNDTTPSRTTTTTSAPPVSPNRTPTSSSSGSMCLLNCCSLKST